MSCLYRFDVGLCRAIKIIYLLPCTVHSLYVVKICACIFIYLAFKVHDMYNKLHVWVCDMNRYTLVQIYIGSSRSVHRNRDVLKDLEVGMLVAAEAQQGHFPRIGRVLSIPPEPTMDTPLSIDWMVQENAAHKPKWLRFWRESPKKDAQSSILFSEIVLYDFQLTKCGALNKKSRDYLQSLWK